MSEPNRREFVIAASAGAAFSAGLAARADSRPRSWPFYAFDNGLRDVKGIDDKVKLLKDLGYDGIEYHLNPKEMPVMLDALDKHGLKMFGIYTVSSLEDSIPANWSDWIKLLKGRDTRIEMNIRSKQHKPSDTRGNAKGVALVKSVSDLCADTGPVVSIYPHTGCWTERVEDGVRIAKLAGRRNVGTHFNLVHWQWVKQTRPLETTLTGALSHLFCITINGLKGPKGKRQKIRPLDDSDFDLASFLSLIKKIGYAGPVGLQCWSVKEPAKDHLKRSIQTWRQLLKTLSTQNVRKQP